MARLDCYQQSEHLDPLHDQVFGIIEPGSMSTIAESPGAYRTVVIDYYKECISRHNNEIFLELRKCKIPDELT